MLNYWWRMKMEKKLTKDLAYSLGYELIIRDGYFILEGVGVPTIKGDIVRNSEKLSCLL